MFRLISSSIGAALIALAVGLGGFFVGQSSEPNTNTYIMATPTPAVVAALPADAQCPKPPRTAGAVFIQYGPTGNVSPDGSDKILAYLSCDFGGQWSYTLRSDGSEQLARYKGTAIPEVYNEKGEIDAILQTLR